jgi:hypothetical protein
VRRELGRRREVVLGGVPGRQLDEVLAGIAVVRQRGRLADRLAQARLERAREGVELVAGVVDVELRGHAGAAAAQQARERVADGGRAGVDDDERPRRVRGHELQAHALAGEIRAAAVAGPGREHLAQRGGDPLGREEDVEEAGAGDLQPRHLGRRREVLDDRLRDLARRAPGRLRVRHRDVARVVAVLGLPRHLPDALRRRRQPGRGERALHSVGETFRQGHRIENAARRRRLGLIIRRASSTIERKSRRA